MDALTESAELPVVIIGAGIAGLTLALALARRGIACHILERAGYLEEVGAGLQLSPNASRILIDLGLGSGLDQFGVRPERISIHDAVRDLPLLELPLGEAITARHGAPYYVIHRGDLQSILLAEVTREKLIRLDLGVVVEAMREAGDSVIVDAFVGDQRVDIPARALIGADGVWSLTRTRLLDGLPSEYSGRTAWRATIPADRLPAGSDLTRHTGLWLGPHAHVVHYPLRGGREVNMVIAVDDDWIDERWDVIADGHDLVTRLHDWPALIRNLVRIPDSWRKWALCAAPRSPWAVGHVALIGDAQHAMLPFAAQGGAMAIEDAAVLARMIARTDVAMPARLAAYASARRHRVARVVSLAARNGTIYHLSGLAAAARNTAMKWMGPGRAMASFDWLYGWRDT